MLILALFIPLTIYLRYGREPKIDYKAEYEHEIPSDDPPPALVNAIFKPKVFKDVGEPDMDGFKATIMDLIDRNYFKIETRKEGKDKKNIFKNQRKPRGPRKLRNGCDKTMRRFQKNDIIPR
ncbi:MAG: hypothetical protein AB7D17_08105 [Methanobacteriales archaeon]|nr:MAG: hypothetical protein XD44_1043 [Methanobacteriaceae archaeon 41_258]